MTSPEPHLTSPLCKRVELVLPRSLSLSLSPSLPLSLPSRLSKCLIVSLCKRSLCVSLLSCPFAFYALKSASCLIKCCLIIICHYWITGLLCRVVESPYLCRISLLILCFPVNFAGYIDFICIVCLQSYDFTSNPLAPFRWFLFT